MSEKKETTSSTGSSAGKAKPRKRATPPAREAQAKSATVNAEPSKPAAQPEPATKPATQPEPARPAAEQPARGGRGGLAVAILALLMAGGVAGAGYWGWQQIDARLVSADQARADGQAKIESLNTELAGLRQSLDRQKQQGEQLQKSLEQAQLENGQVAGRAEALSEQVGTLQGKLLEISGRRPSDWLLAEANHLVRLAGRKLWLEHDVVTAMALLSSADERIRELNDPSLLPLREAISNDVIMLKSLPQFDAEGVALRLSSLQQQVEQLKPLMLELPEASGEPADLSLSESVDDWKQNLTKVWHQISADFITVQRREGPVAPLLSPTQRWYLQENVRNKLIQAQQAVLDEQQALYSQALADAQAWIAEFYQQDSTAVFMQGEIAALAELSIERDYPAELSARKPLEDLIRDRVQALIQTKVETK